MAYWACNPCGFKAVLLGVGFVGKASSFGRLGSGASLDKLFFWLELVGCESMASSAQVKFNGCELMLLGCELMLLVGVTVPLLVVVSWDSGIRANHSSSAAEE